MEHETAQQLINGTLWIEAEYYGPNYSDREPGRLLKISTVKSMTCEWRDGNTIGITDQLLETADPRYLSLTDGVFTICQYRAKVIGHVDEPYGYYVAERID